MSFAHLMAGRRTPLIVAVALVSLGTGAGCSRSSLVAELPATTSNNLVLVPGVINGSKVSLILDTGASASVIHRGRADQLGLRFGRSDDATTGGGSVEAAEVHDAVLTIGAVRLEKLPLYAIDLTALQAGLGDPIDGITGFDLFQRYVIEIDYVAGRVRLHEPSLWTAPTDAETIPIAIEGQIPHVTIGLTSRSGARADARVELDTGQTGSLTLTQPFVDAQRLVDANQPTLAITTGAILAGQVSARAARLGSLRLGRTTLEGPIANITPDATDAATATGLLGGEILRRFDIAIDYSRRHIVLRPNGDIGDPLDFDMTGMSLTRHAEPAGLRVRTIIDGSPAAEAGLDAGDVITRLNGRNAAALRLTDVRQQFRMPGVEVTLTVTRDGVDRQVTLRTRRLI